jgi:hypothetical protein
VGATGRSGAAAWRDGVWPILPLLLGSSARLAQVACAGVAALCCACARRCLRRGRPPRRRPPSVQARASTGAFGARRHLPHRHPSSIGRVGATRSPRLLCPSTLWCETLSTLPFPAACPPPPAPAPDARASTRPCRSLAAAIDWSGSVCSAAVRPARAGTCRVALPARSLLHALTPALQSPPRPPCLLRLPFASFPSARDHHAALHSHDHPCQAYAGPAPAAQGFILAEHTVDDPPALLQQARDAGSSFIVGGCIDTCRGCCCPVFTSKVVACYCARLMLDSV